MRTPEPDPAAIGGLHFFGRISASISHEIKNVLAVIRESAGLMEDLLAMNRQGLPLAPEKFAKLADRVRRQTDRADEIVKHMNQFAHSVDEPSKRVDLGELLALLTALGQRPATMKGLSLTLAPIDAPLTVQSNPFFLELAVWTGLEFALAHPGLDKRIVLAARAAGSAVEVLIEGLAEGLDPLDPALPQELFAALAARLGLSRCLEGRTLTLRVPKQSP